MTGELAVWMYGAEVAVIDQDRRSRLHLQYTDEALRQHEAGRPLLSVRLPVSTVRFSHGHAAPFIENLLPEGNVRRIIAERLGFASGDAFGLIGALGRDCAGALIIQPRNEPLPAEDDSRGKALSSADVSGLLAGLGTAPLGMSGEVRLSLAGVQEKLVLRWDEGSWRDPLAGSPSTHILKPQMSAYRNTVENEAFCMRFAAALGVRAASVSVEAFEGRSALVVERYDRIQTDDGRVERIHQEDFCQALGVMPEKKYQTDGGPSLRQIAQILATAGSENSLERLLRLVVVNVLVGNCDAHGKNFAILHHRDGRLDLAPAYDVVSTRMYPALSDHMAMSIDGVWRVESATIARLVAEAEEWGMSRRQARAIVGGMLDAAPGASDRAADETHGVPEELPEFVMRQIGRVESTV